MSELPEWAAVLPESLRDLPYLKDAKTPEEFKAKVVNDAAYRGQSIRIPTDEAGPDDWNEFNEKLATRVPGVTKVPREDDAEGFEAMFHKLGKPKTADGYNLLDDESFTGDLESLKGYAHNANMTNAQFRVLAKQMSESNTNSMRAQDEALTGGQKILKTEWGNAYQDRMAEVGSVLQDAPSYILEAFNAGKLPADQIRYFYGLRAMGKEASEIVGQDKNATDRITPQEALNRLSDHENKYKGISKSDPDWNYYVNRRVELIGVAYPE